MKIPIVSPSAISEAKIVRMDSRGAMLAQKIGRCRYVCLSGCLRERVPVEGSVLSSNKGGFAIISVRLRVSPYFQMTLEQSKQKNTSVKPTPLITEIKSDELIVSGRRLIEQEREAKKESQLAELSSGMDCAGTILNITGTLLLLIQ